MDGGDTPVFNLLKQIPSFIFGNILFYDLNQARVG